MKAYLSVARPTVNLSQLLKMYRAGLGMDFLVKYDNPDGYRVVFQNSNERVNS